MRTEINNANISNFIDSRYVQVGDDYVGNVSGMLDVLKFGDIISVKMKQDPEEVGYCPLVFLGAKESFLGNPYKYSTIKVLHPNDFINANRLTSPIKVGELRISDLDGHALSIRVLTFRTKNPIISFMGGMGSGKTASSSELKDAIFNKNSDSHISTFSFADTLRSVAFDFISLFSVKIEDETVLDTPSSLKIDHFKTKRIVSLEVPEKYSYQLCYSLTGIQSISHYDHNYRIIEAPDTTYGHASEQFLYYAKDLKEHLVSSEFTIRNLLQTIGTDLVRKEIGKDFWTNRMKSNIIRREYNSYSRKIDEAYYIIDDVRFENEAEFVKSMGGIVIGIKRGDTSAFGSHPSERTMAEHWDTMASVTIDNDGSLLDLRRKINETLKEVPGFIGA